MWKKLRLMGPLFVEKTQVECKTVITGMTDVRSERFRTDGGRLQSERSKLFL